jgi:hypothetical protein
VFRFRSASGDSLTKDEAIIRLTVQKSTNGGWQTVWLMHGSGFFPSVKYGAMPQGMTSDLDAMPLSPRSIYRVAVTVLPSDGPFLYGVRYFRFDQNGRVLPAPRVP